MINVSETAGLELKKVLGSPQADSKELVIYFQGYG